MSKLKLIDRRLFVVGAAGIGVSAALGNGIALGENETETSNSSNSETKDTNNSNTSTSTITSGSNSQSSESAKEENKTDNKESTENKEKTEEEKKKEEEEKEKNNEPDAEEKLAQADAVHQRVLQLQHELGEASQKYYKALDDHEEAVQNVKNAQMSIEDADTKIDILQDRLSKRCVSMYKAGNFTFLDLLLGSTSWKEFTTGLDMYEVLNSNDEKMIEETRNLRDQTEENKVLLEQYEQDAKDAAAQAEKTKNTAQQKVSDMQKIFDALDEEAQQALSELTDRDRADEAAAASAKVRKQYAYTVPSTPIPATGSVVDYALSRIGCPYVWGAEGPETFDCSGLVRWAYLQVGKSVPHQTEALYYAAAQALPVEAAEPGDVLWISYGDGYNGHVGIACNNGGSHYVHAPTFGAFVRDTDSLSWAGFTHALRFA